MATFTGILFDSLPGIPLDTSLYEAVPDAQTIGIQVFDAPFTGFAEAVKGVPSANPRNFGGNVCENFDAVWFNTVHFIPSTVLELGSVSANSVIPFEVWSAFYTPNTLSSITPANDTGLVLSGGAVPPTIFKPLESRTYQIEVAGTGPAIINASYSWVFTSLNILFRVQGRRSIVFAHQPNWKSGLKERWKWNTNVLESYDRTEQRIQVKASPELRMSYEILVHDYEMRELDSQLHMWQGRPFAVPIWSDYIILSEEVSPGATIIVNETVFAGQDYRVGSQILFWQSWNIYESATISEINGGIITLSGPLEQTWVKGSVLMPLRSFRMPSKVVANRVHSNLTMYSVQFISDDMDEWVDLVESPTTYLGSGVLEGESNRVETMQDNYERRMHVLNPGTGAVYYDDTRDSTRLDRTFAWMLQDRAAILLLRQFFAFRRGKLKPVWVPTWQNDLVLAETLGLGGTAMHFFDTEYKVYYNLIGGRRDMRIELKNGTIHYKRIDTVAQDPDQHTILTVDSAFPTDINPGDIRIISFMGLHRLTQDHIDFLWHNPDVVEVSTSMRLLNE